MVSSGSKTLVILCLLNHGVSQSDERTDDLLLYRVELFACLPFKPQHKLRCGSQRGLAKEAGCGWIPSNTSFLKDYVPTLRTWQPGHRCTSFQPPKTNSVSSSFPFLQHLSFYLLNLQMVYERCKSYLGGR